MRDPDRINRIIEKLRLAWHSRPDLRLCQLVENLGLSCEIRGTEDHCIFYVEDDLLEVKLDAWMEQTDSSELKVCPTCNDKLYEKVAIEGKTTSTQCGTCNGLGKVINE